MAKPNAFNEIFKVLKKGPIASDEVLKTVPAYMFCRFLGGHQVTIQAANIFNLYYNQIPMHLQYKMIKQVFAGKGIYPIMIKNTPEDKSLDVICKHYKINRTLAKEYKQYISDEELKRLTDIYTIKG